MRRTVWARMFAAVTILAVTLGGCTLIPDGTRTPSTGTGTQSETPRHDAITYYTLTERPGYRSMVDTIHAANEEIDRMLDDQNTFETWLRDHNIPLDMGEDTKKYVTDYVAILGKLDGLSALDGLVVSTDPGELDDIIAGRLDDFNQVQDRFSKGDPLEVKVTIHGRDGSTYETDPGNRIELADPWEDIEPRIAAFNGDGGSWMDRAQQTVELAGLQIDWNYEDIREHCTQSKTAGEDSTFAAYCPVTPNIVYARTEANGWDTAYAVAGVKHELAHHAFHMRCGTTAPPVTMQNGVDLTEAATSSYAVRYLGADANELNMTVGEEYRMSELSDAIADSVHNNSCTVLQ